MRYEIISILCGGKGFTAPGDLAAYRQIDNRQNQKSPCALYQEALETSKSDILVYAHDDVLIMDPEWISKIDAVFIGEDVAAVGLGGATGLGNDDLYRKPFNIWNMARSGYCSNQEDAETHGARLTGFKRVAVLDAFFMAIRRDFLLSIGGWPVQHLTHHCLDLWLACEAARHNKKLWMAGIKCNHYGGGSSIKQSYQQAKWLQGGSTDMDHLIPHTWLHKNYRDVLPIKV